MPAEVHALLVEIATAIYEAFGIVIGPHRDWGPQRFRRGPGSHAVRADTRG